VLVLSAVIGIGVVVLVFVQAISALGRRGPRRHLAIGAVTLVFSVLFLTLFGLIDEPRVRDWIGNLLYRR
jgi:hypothetical protein